MFKPNIFLPLNISRTKPNNSLITASFKNDAINLLDWLGIDLTNGNSSLVLSQNGTWVFNNASVISKTLAEMQALSTAATLEFPATYLITDIADEGLVVESTSASTIASLGNSFYWIPNYEVTGVYKGQLLPIDTVVTGERWIWGNQIWESLDGTNPAFIDQLTLDVTHWSLVSKSVANHYTLLEFSTQFDLTSGKITGLKQIYSNNEAYVTSANQVYNNDSFLTSWSNPNNTELTTYVGNVGSIVNNRINGGLVAFNRNENFSTDPYIYNNLINGELAGNTGVSQSSIFDNELVGVDSVLAGNFLERISTIKNCSLDNNGHVSINKLLDSTIDGVTVNIPDTGSYHLGIYDCALNESIISNVTNIAISNNEFHGIDIDFTGWTRDVQGVSIIHGNGICKFSHDFGANPVTAGSSAFGGFIPINAVVTRLVLQTAGITGAAGALLQVGIETDQPSYCLAATAVGTITNTVINTVSNKTTAHRSIRLAASVANVTSGVCNIQVEYLIV